MNARLAALLTGAHAPRWRRRYGAEFCALLEDLPATPAILTSASVSALTSRGPALAAIGAFALAAAVLAFGPAASDRPAIAVQSHALHGLKTGMLPSARSACDDAVAYVAPDGTIRC